MTTVLAIETSTPHGSVALLRDGEVAFSARFIADRSHGSALIPPLEEVRGMVDALDIIAVGLGPGSYAGVRIAIATAMGLGLALGARLVGLPGVAALDVDAPRYIAVGDARRDTFYFTHVVDGACIEGPLLLGAREVAERVAALPGLPVFAPEPVAIFPQATVAFPDAVRLARLAAAGRGIVAEGALEPLYLREPHITQPKPR